MKNLRMFEIKYIGPSNVKGSRVKVTDTRNDKSVTLSYDYATDSFGTAQHFLESKGIYCLSRSWNEKTGLDDILTDDFETQIK